MSFLRVITSYGISPGHSQWEKRNIILTNYISLVVACAPMLLILAVFFLVDFDFYLIGRLLFASFIFLFPIAANRLGYINLSRILLCWLPSVVIFSVVVADVKAGSAMSASSYVGVRLFLLPIGCFPFLIFNLKDWKFMTIGLLGSFLSLLLFDPIFASFGVAYWERNPVDPFYAFNNIRALVSFFTVGLSCFLLKLIVERNEILNDRLLSELAVKNALIKQEAENDVHLLNRKLTANLQQLQERELILNRSQQIAKIGSWEYTIVNASLFCSDEIYNIFGLDHDFNLQVENLSRVFPVDDCKVLIQNATLLLETGKQFDITLRALTPFGYAKWIRVNAFPIEENNKIAGVQGICHDITYFKESEELLRISENKYRSLFEQASDFIMILDFNGKFIDVNASFCDAFGYTKNELVELKIEDLIEPAQIRVRPIMYKELARGEHVLSDRRMMRKDRTIIEVEANVRKIQDSLMLVIARDVTKFREVQRQIELSEASFRGAFEYSAIGMSLVSVDNRWLKVNRELCQIVGYSPEELLQLRVRDITFPADRDNDSELLQKAVDGEIETYRREKRYVHKNGSIVWAQVNVSLIRDSVEQPLYFVAQVEDITIKKKAEEQLQVSQANLNATINNTEVLIWSLDSSLRIITFNNPFARHMKNNYGIEISVGLQLLGEDSVLGKEMAEKWSNRFSRALNGENFTEEETRVGIDFQYSLSPILEAGNIIGATVFADNITERKIREKELDEANKKISEFKLMALRSVMSPHFIFNVLNSIQFYIAKSDRLNAINYLSTFSKLIRSILTHSIDNKIKLTEEIEMLKNYVLLESTRFDNKFNFIFEIEPQIEPGSVQIPSLLIQPYVENAILHGLYNKKQQGTLIIRIKELDESIIFEIEDNGIGRAAAIDLRKQNFPAHKSMGIRLTEERLKLINQEHHSAFAIEDLVDGEGQACGTKVTIRITI
jgi:PAS domain S-box-containing protein